MSKSSPKERFRLSALAHTTIYVIVLAAIFVLLLWLFPGIRDVIFDEPVPSNMGFEDFEATLDQPGGPRASPLPLLSRGLVALVLLVSSILFAAPLAWMYMVTKRQEGYEKTFVQVLVLLPVVVTAVVRVVRDDLALAFALAGIVAAVRFRTTLRDLKNAVFAFAAIGIGLASGTGSFMVAGVLSLIFCMVVYVLWYHDVGGLDPTAAERSGPMRLAEALVPGETHEAVAVGNEKMVQPLPVEEMEKLHENIDRLARFVRADALKSKKKYDTLLLIYASDEKLAQEMADELVEDYASRWHLVDTFPGPEDTVVLEYLLRLKKDAEVGEFLERLNCGKGCPLVGAELKRMKGLRKMMT